MKPKSTLITPTYTLLPGADQVLTAIATGDSALRAYYLRPNLVAGFDDLLSLDSIDFTPFDYQIKAVRRFRGRGMLSDKWAWARAERWIGQWYPLPLSSSSLCSWIVASLEIRWPERVPPFLLSP